LSPKTKQRNDNMNQNFKKVAIAAAGVATVFSLAVATPSFAAQTGKNGVAVAPKLAVASTVLPISITDIPTTVTDAHAASHGATFTVYLLAADATAVPATQPTTGGKVVKAMPGTLTGTSLAGALPVKGGVAGSTTKLAVYPSSGGSAALVTVAVSANGIATATTSAPLTATYVAPAVVEKPAKGERPADVSGSVRAPKGDHADDQGKGGNGHGPKGKKGKGGKR
jgi:hypothetical protein